MANRLLFKLISFLRTTLLYTLTLLFFITLTYSCKKEPPVGPPHPPVDIIKNTINISVEWTDLYRIKLKWNKAEDDKQNNYRYNLTRKDENGNEITRTFYITGNDTSYVDDNNGDSLEIGKTYIYRIKAFNKEDELKDTSKTITAATLSPTSHNIEWRVDTLGQPGNFLYDVWGLDENNVYAVGYVQMPEGPTGIIKWDGQKWNSFPASGGVKHGIFGFDLNNIFVVGESMNGGFAAIYDGNIWREFYYDYFLSRGDTVYPLSSVWGSSPDNVWAVGSQGTIIHWNGIEWRKRNTNILPNMNLWDIWGFGDSLLYVIGNERNKNFVLYKFQNNQWNIKLTHLTGSSNRSTIWGPHEDHLFVIDLKKYVITKNSGYEFELTDQKAAIYKIRGSQNNAIFTVGAFSEVFYHNGISWKKQEQLYSTNDPALLRGIWTNGKEVIIVGLAPNKGAIFIKGKIGGTK